MKNYIIVIIAVIIAIIIVGGAVAYVSFNGNEDTQKVENTTTVDNNNGSDKVSNVTSDDSGNSSDDDIVSVEIKYNYQAGGGYYREVTYKDGGFRQFDVETGELIGSSYPSDQSKLPSME